MIAGSCTLCGPTPGNWRNGATSASVSLIELISNTGGAEVAVRVGHRICAPFLQAICLRYAKKQPKDIYVCFAEHGNNKNQ